MTQFSDEYRQRYGFGGWDDLRPQSECLMCNGTGRADDHNECGFCHKEDN